MTQAAFPEIQASTQALVKQITVVEAEIGRLQDAISEKKWLVKGLRQAIAAVNPKQAGQKQVAAA